MHADPWVPFTITLRSGEAFAVDSVGQLMLGRDTFCYLNHEGYFRIVPYRAVGQVSAVGGPLPPTGSTQTPEVH